jgi:glutathione S-transferase
VARPVLYVGNKNYSSWSLRPWLALRWAGIAFDEVVLPLGGPGYGEARMPAVLAVSPTGKVPALDTGGVVISDSLAIIEWAAEQAPSLWPSEPLRRALARSAACEMHASFGAVRRDLSMNLRRRLAAEPEWPEDTRRDLARIVELFEGLRAENAARGPWLFGERSAVDAMYAPVVCRLRTYAVPVPDASAAYSAVLFADPDFRVWESAAEAEVWTIPATDRLHA